MAKEKIKRSPAWYQRLGTAPLLAFPAQFIVLGIILWIVGQSSYTSLDVDLVIRISLPYGLGVGALYAGAALYCLYRQAARRFWILTAVILSLLGGGIFGSGLLIYLNGAWDNSPPNHLRAIVMDKETVDWVRQTRYRVKVFTFYKLYVKSWRAPGAREVLLVPRGVYEKATPFSSEVDLVTRGGWLGAEWIESLLLVRDG